MRQCCFFEIVGGGEMAHKYFDTVIEELCIKGKKVDADLLLGNSLKYIPRNLYKYRKCNKNGFDMLENGYVWADIPDHFVDPIDSKINLKLKKELPNIQRWINQHIGELLYYNIKPKGMQSQKSNFKLCDYINAQKHFVNEEGELDSKLMKREMILEMKKLSKQQRQDFQKLLDFFKSKEFEEVVTKSSAEAINKFVNHLRTSKIIASLTCRRDNSTMWENYANEYKGFCVEYELPAYNQITEKQKNILVNLFPVKYYKRIPGVSVLPIFEYDFYKTLYDKELDIHDTIVELFRQLIYKKYEYNYEEEWRIILDESIARKIEFPFVKAVYAGYKIKKGNLNRLKNICAQKGIPLYQQVMNTYATKFEYVLVDE